MEKKGKPANHTNDANEEARFMSFVCFAGPSFTEGPDVDFPLES